MDTTTTASEIIAAVRKLATDWPDAVYDSGELSACMYDAGTVEYGPPHQQGCIFGQAGLSLGILDQFPGSDSGGVGIDTVLDDYLEVVTTQDERKWVVAVQNAQDEHMTWRQAVAKADKLVP